ncbi:hypothetical protein D1006_31315 [Burkholderia stabilis]|uniref:Uncharacterized protein n=1 Tax=Burkholderia stabilis TaxID=95485 RepID=A0A4Q2AK38_9BURK|nr:hypothetical protein D1006_31315 [Burkholderia stabilis]
MESVSWQTSRAVAEQSACLFVLSARAFDLAAPASRRGRLIGAEAGRHRNPTNRFQRRRARHADGPEAVARRASLSAS